MCTIQIISFSIWTLVILMFFWFKAECLWYDEERLLYVRPLSTLWTLHVSVLLDGVLSPPLSRHWLVSRRSSDHSLCCYDVSHLLPVSTHWVWTAPLAVLKNSYMIRDMNLQGVRELVVGSWCHLHRKHAENLTCGQTTQNILEFF